MTPLERMAEKYWNAFRDGYARVGGDAREYPTWAESNDPVKEETMRCLHHAIVHIWKEVPSTSDGRACIEVLRQLFPGVPKPRSIKPTATEEKFAGQQR